MKVRDVWLDFVNLRSESYADESRIPTMSFGTPLEDAMRRDLTINALYYNLNEKKVEDFTGKGIEDLKIGLCRTPLEAKRRQDDPLRGLTVSLQQVRVYIGGRYWCRGGRRTSERRVEKESEQRTSREGSSGDVERT